MEVTTLDISDETSDSSTCRVMDNVGQYLSVFFSNFTQSPITCRAVRGAPSLCNTVRCDSATLSTSTTLLACSNPIGLTRTFSRNGDKNNITIFKSGSYNISRGVLGEYTLENLGSHTIGLEVSCELGWKELLHRA